jgi:hypothetical protein
MDGSLKTGSCVYTISFASPKHAFPHQYVITLQSHDVQHSRCAEIKRHTHTKNNKAIYVKTHIKRENKLWKYDGVEEQVGRFGWFLPPQTTKHIRGGWSHYTDTSEPVDGGVL